MKKLPWSKIQNVPTELTLGTSQAKEVRDDFNQLKKQTSRHQQEAQNTQQLLDRVSKEFEELQTTYYDMLRLLCESLLMQEVVLQSMEKAQQMKMQLADKLKMHGVERFAPTEGDGIPKDKCTVMAYYPTNEYYPGSVAKVVSDGFRKDGRILVYPVVFESVAKEKGQNQSSTKSPQNNNKPDEGGK
jgi:molecular chaperone GrpE (heat shock protein)